MPRLVASGLTAVEFVKVQADTRDFPLPADVSLAKRRSSTDDPEAMRWDYGDNELDPTEVGPACPELSSSFLSRLTLSWIFPVLQQGTKKTLDFCDVFELAPEDRCAFSAARIMRGWDREVAAAIKKCARRSGGDGGGIDLTPHTSLFRTLLYRAWGPRIASLAVLRALGIIAMYAQPVVLEQFVSSVDAEGGTQESRAWFTLSLAVALFAAALCSAVLDTAYGYEIQRLATKSRLGLQRVLIAKALRLSGKSRRTLGVGAIISHLQMDCRLVSQAIVYVNMVWGIPAQLMLCVFLLYRQLGNAAFAGFAVTAVMSPMIFVMTQHVKTYRRLVMKRRDKRIKFLTELLQGSKTIKMFAWEIKVRAELASLRASELQAIRATQLSTAITQFLAQALPTFVAVATFAAYTASGNVDLTPARAFTSLALLGLLSAPLAQIPVIITSVVGGRVAATRINAFLHSEEFVETVVASFEDIKTVTAKGPTMSPLMQQRPSAGINGHSVAPLRDSERRCRYFRYLGNDSRMTTFLSAAAAGVSADAPIALVGTFRWPSTDIETPENKSGICGGPFGLSKRSLDAKPTPAKASSLPAIRDVLISIPRGALLVVSGRVGAGKSSLLAALLNELEADDAYGRAALSGQIAYCAQEPWIRNKPLRDNILFGKPFNEQRYAAVLDACALAPDIAQLPHGDATQIGERGLNLSGGQKARVALARALYADLDVYLLDDVLAAVDRHTSTSLLEKVFLPSGLLRSGRKTVVLVTNQTDWIHQADLILVLGGGGNDCGKVLAFGTPKELAAAGVDPASVAREDAMRAADEPLSTGAEEADGVGKGDGRVGKGKGKNGKGKGKRGGGKVGSGEIIVAKAGAGDGATEDGLVTAPPVGPTAADPEVVMKGGSSGPGVEKRERGAVSSHIWLLYAKSLGLRWMLLVLFFYVASQSLRTVGDYVLAVWSRSEGRAPAFIRAFGPVKAVPGLEGVDAHLIAYAVLLFASAGAVLLRSVSLVQANLRAATSVHEKALWAVLRSPMDFFDTTTSGSVLNRFSSDQQLVDMQLRGQMASLFNSAFQLVAGLGVVLATSPVVLVLLPPLFVVFRSLQATYSTSAREVQRLQSIARSPILQEVSEMVGGLATVRAFRKGPELQRRVAMLIDRQARAIRCSNTMRVWLTLRLEALGAVVILGVGVSASAAEAWSPGGADAALVGLSLSYALKVTNYLNSLLTSVADAELGLVAMERLNQFADLTPEAPLKFPLQAAARSRGSLELAPALVVLDDPASNLALEDGTRVRPAVDYSSCLDPPATWPDAGAIAFEDVRMRYRPGLPLVLRGLTFSVGGGQKIGIVGRTGSGKSSLLGALFRLPGEGLCGGRIVIDGFDVARVGLHTLRARIAIIPQDPVLLSGSLRSNLDPFNEYSDAAVLAALDSVGLRKTLEQRAPAALSTLTTKPSAKSWVSRLSTKKAQGASGSPKPAPLLSLLIEPYGENLSVGQRQLVCIARGLLKRCRIAVLDEATAAIDKATDEVIQRTLRGGFGTGTTVLTVAHRLETIVASDMILFMDAGRVAEFGPPAALLEDRASHFASLWFGRGAAADTDHGSNSNSN